MREHSRFSRANPGVVLERPEMKPAWKVHLARGTCGEDRTPVCRMQWNLARIVTTRLTETTCRRCLAEAARNLVDWGWDWVTL